MVTLTLDFYTSHHQFYIADQSSPFRTDVVGFWTQEASDNRLAIEEGLLGIGTECYGPVKGDLTILNASPDAEDLSRYDHVVEGSLNLVSGILQIFGCLDKEPTIEWKLPPSTYRVRIYSSNLASVDGDSGEDFYGILMWPENYHEPRVLKR